MKFLDKVKIFVSAGDGGPGTVSFARNKIRTPDGGNGGCGANVIIKAGSHMSSLMSFSRQSHFYGAGGVPGQRNNRKGASPRDLILRVPIGTTIIDREISYTISSVEDEIIIAKGGRGGLGNHSFVDSVNQYTKQTSPPTTGEKKWIFLHYAFLGDVAIVGDPNSGKSSFLQTMGDISIPEGNYGFKHTSPIFVTLNKIKFIEIPSNNYYIHQALNCRIVVLFLNSLKLIENKKITDILDRCIIVFSKWDILNDEQKTSLLEAFPSGFRLSDHPKSVESLQKKILQFFNSKKISNKLLEKLSEN